MKKMIEKLQEKAGFISLEAVIIWGLIIALGAWAWTKFYAESQLIVDHAIKINSTAMDVKVSA